MQFGEFCNLQDWEGARNFLEQVNKEWLKEGRLLWKAVYAKAPKDIVEHLLKNGCFCEKKDGQVSVLTPFN